MAALPHWVLWKGHFWLPWLDRKDSPLLCTASLECSSYILVGNKRSKPMSTPWGSLARACEECTWRGHAQVSRRQTSWEPSQEQPKSPRTVKEDVAKKEYSQTPITPASTSSQPKRQTPCPHWALSKFLTQKSFKTNKMVVVPPLTSEVISHAVLLTGTGTLGDLCSPLTFTFPSL